MVLIQETNIFINISKKIGETKNYTLFIESSTNLNNTHLQMHQNIYT